MALVNMKVLLEKAKKQKYGIGAFNVANMEMIIGSIKAAEELNTPIILQIAEIRLNYSPIELIGPMMIAAAKNAKIPVAVHLDHGTTKKSILKALEIGFTSVMIDGSKYTLEENIKLIQEIVEIAKKYNADVEAEIGVVGGSEDGREKNEIKYSSVEEAKEMVKKTKIDALAIAIGNTHGFYKLPPKLNFKLLDEINKNIPDVNLVLHGGSGLLDSDFKEAISFGITKINVATATFTSVFDNIIREYKNGHIKSYFHINSAMVEGAYKNVKKHIKIFNKNN